MSLNEELETAADDLAEARERVRAVQSQRDKLVVAAVKQGMPRKLIASTARIAEVSVYKIIERFKGDA